MVFTYDWESTGLGNGDNDHDRYIKIAKTSCTVEADECHKRAI